MLTTGTAVRLLPGKAECLHQEYSSRRFQPKSSALLSANISKQNNGKLFQRNQTFPSPINGGFGLLQNRKMKYMSFVCCSMESGGDPSSFPFNLLLPAGTEQWQLWLLGSVIPLILSFSAGRWGPLLKLKDDADKLLDRAEQISDVVEEMAEKVEKVADEIGDQLPEGGKLRAVLDRVEDLADQTGKTAERAGELIDKVQEMEDKMEEFMESVDDKDNNNPSVNAKHNNKVKKAKDE